MKRSLCFLLCGLLLAAGAGCSITLADSPQGLYPMSGTDAGSTATPEPTPEPTPPDLEVPVELRGTQTERDGSTKSLRQANFFDVQGNLTRSDHYIDEVLDNYDVYFYDDQGNCTQAEYYRADGTLSRRVEYDTDGNPVKEVAYIIDPRASNNGAKILGCITTTTEYDALGRPSTITVTGEEDGKQQAITGTYIYNEDTHTSELRVDNDPDAYVSYTYDEQWRLISIGTFDETGTVSSESFQYDAYGNVVSDTISSKDSFFQQTTNTCLYDENGYQLARKTVSVTPDGRSTTSSLDDYTLLPLSEALAAQENG